MATALLSIPFTRQFALAQPNITVQALRGLIGVSLEEDLLLLRGTEDHLLADSDQIDFIYGDRLTCRLRHKAVTISINGADHTFPEQLQTGSSLKAAASINPLDALALEAACGQSEVITNDHAIHLRPGMCFVSAPGGHYGAPDHEELTKDHHPPPAGRIEVVINLKPIFFENPNQTGASLKAAAGIDPQDALALEGPCGQSDVIPNGQAIHLKLGMTFVSAPGGHYGAASAVDLALPPGATMVLQPDGWTHVFLGDFRLPGVYTPGKVEILVRLPPTFPDGAPDMFWVRPNVTLVNGATPQATSVEYLNGPWMRFSWHLQPGGWRPGRSTFADYVRFIQARFARGD